VCVGRSHRQPATQFELGGGIAPCPALVAALSLLLLIHWHCCCHRLARYSLMLKGEQGRTPGPVMLDEVFHRLPPVKRHPTFYPFVQLLCWQHTALPLIVASGFPMLFAKGWWWLLPGLHLLHLCCRGRLLISLATAAVGAKLQSTYLAGAASSAESDMSTTWSE